MLLLPAMSSPTENYRKQISVSSSSFYFDLWDVETIQFITSEELINRSGESVSVLAHRIMTKVLNL